jgi:hypothetical protein
VASGCSSSAGHADTAPTTSAAPRDAPARIVAFCAAWTHLAALGQATSGTSVSNLSNVAQNILDLREIAHQFEAQPPASIAGPARRYGAVIESVADSLAQTTPATSSPTLAHLTVADSASLGRYAKLHCTR